jgi:hypothetical protein
MALQHEHHDHGNTTGIHGMLLFGEERIYLSHLPMFNHLHHFQIHIEVSFGDDVRAVLAADRKDAGDEIHTFVPEPFPITDMDGPVRTSLNGTIFHGHFERGGKPIAEKVTANIEQVVTFRTLDLAAKHDDTGVLTYLCFGRAGKLYLAHEITARPDFDHILTGQLVPGTVRDQMGRPLPDDDVLRGFATAAPVSFSGRADTPGTRLVAGDRAAGLFFATAAATGAHGFTVEVTAGREIYLEIDELG